MDTNRCPSIELPVQTLIRLRRCEHGTTCPDVYFSCYSHRCQFYIIMDSLNVGMSFWAASGTERKLAKVYLLSLPLFDAILLNGYFFETLRNCGWKLSFHIFIILSECNIIQYNITSNMSRSATYATKCKCAQRRLKSSCAPGSKCAFLSIIEKRLHEYSKDFYPTAEMRGLT